MLEKTIYTLLKHGFTISITPTPESTIVKVGYQPEDRFEYLEVFGKCPGPDELHAILIVLQGRFKNKI